MLGEITLGNQNLATSANPASAAHTVDINTERARSFKHTCALGEIAAFARWRTNDAVQISHGISGVLRGCDDHYPRPDLQEQVRDICGSSLHSSDHGPSSHPRPKSPEYLRHGAGS